MDVMVRDVVTVHPDTDVADVIRLPTEHDVSALPVLDEKGGLVGILSEADLIHRFEIGTEKRRPWWVEAVTGASTLATEFAKSHGSKVSEIMPTGVISVSEDTSLLEIAGVLERNRIKRVPLVKDGKLVGFVSRANLIQVLASVVGSIDQYNETDRQIRSICLVCKNKRGPISVAGTSRSATAWCISGGSSARRQSARHCSRLRRACREYLGFQPK